MKNMQKITFIAVNHRNITHQYYVYQQPFLSITACSRLGNESKRLLIKFSLSHNLFFPHSSSANGSSSSMDEGCLFATLVFRIPQIYSSGLKSLGLRIVLIIWFLFLIAQFIWCLFKQTVKFYIFITKEKLP